jgi:hypothetical protein
VQCKDIPDRPILEYLSRQTRWATHWISEIPESEWPNVRAAMPTDIDEKLGRAKMSMLLRRGLVDGCDCGCRGDWQITDEGREWLASHNIEKRPE